MFVFQRFLRDKYGMFEPDLLPWRTIRDALSDTPDPKSNHGIIDHIFRDGARTYPGHTGSDFDWSYGDSLLNIPIMQHCQHGIVSVFGKLSP